MPQCAAHHQWETVGATPGPCVTVPASVGGSALTVLGKTLGGALPASAREGRQGAEAAFVSSRTTVPLSQNTSTPPPQRRGTGDVNDLFVQTQTRAYIRRHQAAHLLSLYGPPPPHGKPPHGLRGCIWMPLVNGTDNSPVSGTADPPE